MFPEKARKPCTSHVWVHYSTRKPHENNNFASFDSSHLPFRAKRCIDPESRENVSNLRQQSLDLKVKNNIIGFWSNRVTKIDTHHDRHHDSICLLLYLQEFSILDCPLENWNGAIPETLEKLVFFCTFDHHTVIT